MLSTLINKTVGLFSEAADVAVNVGSAVMEDVSNIPDAISNGWENGLSSTEEITNVETPQTSAKEVAQSAT